jgi:hypothetical protein
MVECEDDKEVTYLNSETGFGSLRIVNGVDRMIYISDTNIQERHRSHTNEHTICSQIYLQIPIDPLDLEVKT